MVQYGRGLAFEWDIIALGMNMKLHHFQEETDFDISIVAQTRIRTKFSEELDAVHTSWH
jgi:hypothetical protein